LEGPFREVLESGKPDFPFCLCWANENWTRRWDGLDQEILMKQTYLSGDEVAFIEELIPAFYDGRYIKVDGRPLLVVYSPAKLPDPQKSFAIWRDVARAHGLPDLYLAGVQAFGFEDHRLYGLDADIEFPVHFQVGHDGRNAWGVSRQEQDFQGRILSYFHNKSYGVTRPKPPYTLLKGVMPMWDNTARRMGKGTIFRTRNLTPESYYHWLASTVEYTRTHFVGDERLIFINAWNEWGEGCYLEPDQRVGRSLLRATRRALTQVSGCERSQPTIVDTQRAMEIVFVSHDAARAGAQRLLLTLIEWLRDHRGVQPKIILRRGGVLAQEFHRLGPVLVVESLLQDGPDRLKQEVLRFCGNSASLVYINTLVPGGVAAILAGLQVPMITHVHEMEHAIQRWCDKDQLATLLRLTTRFVAASPPVAYNLETNHGVAASRMTTIYEFIRCSDDNAASIDKAYLRREMGLRNGGPVIFGCGTTDWRKGPDLFIETAHHAVKMGLGNAHFYWIGGNTSITEGEDLAAKIRTLGLENTVTFLGEVLEPRRYFPAGDAFLLTSREDPYPLVCLEAADCGVPIICFEGAGGMPDFVGEDAGYRVPFENTQAMAEKLVALFSHAGLQEQLGARAREKVRSQHDITVTGNQIWQTILEVASEPCDGDSLVGSSAPVGVVRDGPTRS
jgi:glycosyltransferase involved in cell wall biosynthesis